VRHKPSSKIKITIVALILLALPASGWCLLGQPTTATLDGLGIDSETLQVMEPGKLHDRGMTRVKRGDRITLIPDGEGQFTLRNARTGEALHGIK